MLSKKKTSPEIQLPPKTNKNKNSLHKEILTKNRKYEKRSTLGGLQDLILNGAMEDCKKK